MGTDYSFAKTPLNAAHAPLAMASISHAGFDFIDDMVKETASLEECYGKMIQEPIR